MLAFLFIVVYSSTQSLVEPLPWSCPLAPRLPCHQAISSFIHFLLRFRFFNGTEDILESLFTPMPRRQAGREPQFPLYRRILQRVTTVRGYLMRGLAAGRGANVPVNVPVIGRPRMTPPSLETGPDHIMGRPRMDAGNDRNDDADAPVGDRTNGALNTADDPELLAHRRSEVYRNLRLLSDDRLYLHLSAQDWTYRVQLLDWYRENRFAEDISLGRHDGFTEASHSVEHDSYYSDLWKRMSGNSPQAAAALNQRIQPHRKPRIALTVPPRYEPSDLPPYTATTAPPNYSASLPEGHLARNEVPLCTSPDCPLRVYGIEHSLGLYHHNGRVGPRINPRDSQLPNFGQSNPPPNVWDAYNHLILDINSDYQANLVKAFVRLHSRPWSLPVDYNESPANKGIDPVAPGASRSKPTNSADRWMQDQARRIPRYSYDVPGAAAEPSSPNEQRLADMLNARRTLPSLPQNDGASGHLVEHNNNSYLDSTVYPQQADHRRGHVQAHSIRVHHPPAHFPGISEVIDQGLVPAPLRILRVVNPDIVVEEEPAVDRQPQIRFADEMDWEANQERPQ
ncbi:MAG: hypothetical protein Q9169_004024 [Polycauliona sp. 2 TL-2023]